MPIYEYICEDCQTPFEKYIPSFRATVSCPACDGENVEKQLSSFACSGGESGFRSSVGGGCGGGSCAGCSGGCGCHH